MLMKRVPTIRNRFLGFVRLGLHPFQGPEYEAHFAKIESGQGRFHPLSSLHRYAIMGFGDPVEVLGTMVVIEPLTGAGKQGLDVFPYPLGSITDDTQAHLLLGNHTGLFDLLEGLAELLVVLHLMPAQEMDDALVIDQREAKALGISPLAVPRGASGPRVPLPSSSPQLQVIERFWKVLRRRATHNRLFPTMAQLKQTLRNNLCYYQTLKHRVLSVIQSARKRKTSSPA